MIISQHNFAMLDWEPMTIIRTNEKSEKIL